MLIGGLVQPAERLGIVFRYSFAVMIHLAKIELGLRVSLFGGLSIPAERFTKVFGHSFCVEVPIAKFVLSGGVPSLSACAKFGQLGPFSYLLSVCSPSE